MNENNQVQTDEKTDDQNEDVNTSESMQKQPKKRTFPIVGIGCSAGGLEALESFIPNIPPDSNIAYVIVQHMDPAYKGMLSELLQRITSIPIFQITEGMKVKRNQIYVIPPNKDISLSNGHFYLVEPEAPHGLHLPVDFFFRSLAEELRELAIGVILSGMGTDGTLGLKAIKEKAGIVFVQDPETAKFNGMPLSAIDAGHADVIAPSEDLPHAIISYIQQSPLLGTHISTKGRDKTSSLQKILLIVRSHTGHDFAHYKSSTLYRRIERRMGIHKIETIHDYLKYLQENNAEVELLFNEFLIGVTNFFRDKESWENLKNYAIIPLLSNHSSDIPVRIWVAGCSTGEEAYTIAILIQEAIDELYANRESPLPTVQIYATDLDSIAIDKARQGIYPVNIVSDVSQERLNRFFTLEEDKYRIIKNIRDNIVFATQNLIMDPPFTKLDLICCRNVLIYFSSELQKNILPLFHYSLLPGGILFLGSAESIGGFTNLFTPLEPKSRIFSKIESPIPVPQFNYQSIFPSVPSETIPKKIIQGKEKNLEYQVYQVLHEQFTPAAVLVNEKGDILFISGKTGKYLELASGKAAMNIYLMARDSFKYELAAAFTKVVREREDMVVHGLKTGTNGGEKIFDLIIQPINDSEILKGTILIVFKDIPTPEKKRYKKSIPSITLIDLENENQHLREEMSTLREEMQTSQEELRSTNEELQSTNEELQSTNEELTTSKEEMQSLNEELQTVNSELQAKVEDLSRANNDMKNLLNSTDIATVFLDNDLKVRRYTNQATTIIRLIGSDIGRPLTDLAISLDYPELVHNANEVLRTLIFHEKIVSSDDGRLYNVKIMPYRTLDNRIDGLVMTFIDISKAKNMYEKDQNASKTRK